MSGQFTQDWLLRHQLRQGLRSATGIAEAEDAPESTLHELIEDYCAQQGWLTVRSRMDRATTTRKGVCDFIIYADGGRMFHIECKRASGKLSVDQQGFIAWAEKLGHRVAVVRSFAEFMEVVR